MATTIDSRARETNDKDPYQLQGLEQAIYLLEELCGGTEKNSLIQKMRGDQQLVDMWMNFLQHNHWIALSARQWVLTEKGKSWVNQIKNVLPALKQEG